MADVNYTTIRDNAVAALNAILTEGYKSQSQADRLSVRLEIEALQKTILWAEEQINLATAETAEATGGMAAVISFSEPA